MKLPIHGRGRPRGLSSLSHWNSLSYCLRVSESAFSSLMPSYSVSHEAFSSSHVSSHTDSFYVTKSFKDILSLIIRARVLNLTTHLGFTSHVFSCEYILSHRTSRLFSPVIESAFVSFESASIASQTRIRFSAKGHATPRLLAKLSVIRHFTERHEDAPSRPLHGPGSMSVIAPAVSEIRAKPSDTICLLLLLLESTSGRFYIGDTRLKNKSTNLLKVTPRHLSSQTFRQQLQRHLEPH